MQAFERELGLQQKIDDTLHEMETNYRDELVEELGKYQEEFGMLDGYTIQSKAEEILEGLGFKTHELNQPLKNFSGGWRMRVMLAKLLLQKPALLLLDEPTNHLDLPSIQWIEKYIANYENAVIVVSHDRQFLDNVIQTTVEVAHARLNVYSGNYSFYLEEKELRNEIQQSSYENQQAQIRQTERFVERFKAKATKAKQVQSRVKALQRMDVIEEVVEETAKVHFRFKFGTQPGRHVMQLNDISKDYGKEKIILNDTTATIERGDKIALIGANGKGKSTLLRIIAGTEKHAGERRMGHNVNFSFYAQHQLESLHVNETLLEELRYADPTKSENELRSILGAFLFGGEDAFKKIKVLSGGEKSRVALAKVLISEANFLLLDEPTNHLDMQSVNILIQALQQYEGTYVTVSHDRHFVSNTATKIWFIEEQEIKQYPGTYDEYLVASQNGSDGLVPIEEDNSNNKSAPKTAKPEPKKEKKQATDYELKQLEKAIEELETKVMELEDAKKTIEKQLADTTIYEDTDKLTKLTAEYENVKADLAKNSNAWEEKVEELEEIN
jgi:ATP-binding cassette subfamily F protein 3